MNSDQLRVSVLVSAKDAAAIIERTIRSAVNALEPGDEIIAVDDGSRDDTGLQMARLLEGTPHKLLRTTGLGLTGALRLGVEAAAGDLIARIDAGDTMTVDRLRAQRARFVADPELVLCGGNVRYVDDDGRVIDVSDLPQSPIAIVLCLLVARSPVVHSTWMVRRSSLLAIGSYREYFRYAQDYDAMLRLSRVGRITNIPDVVGDFLVASGSISDRRTAEQRRFGVTAQRAHIATLIGIQRALPKIDGPVAWWPARRVELARSFAFGAREARSRGQNEKALMLQVGSMLLFPIASGVGHFARIVDRWARTGRVSLKSSRVVDGSGS